MPEICRFYGITIKMYWNDHEPPHFHAEYAGETGIIDIEMLSLIDGRLPARALGLTVEWAAQHRAELRDLWQEARAMRPLAKLPPLS